VCAAVRCPLSVPCAVCGVCLLCVQNRMAASFFQSLFGRKKDSADTKAAADAKAKAAPGTPAAGAAAGGSTSAGVGIGSGGGTGAAPVPIVVIDGKDSALPAAASSSPATAKPVEYEFKDDAAGRQLAALWAKFEAESDLVRRLTPSPSPPSLRRH
jgi:hypothetical protein